MLVKWLQGPVEEAISLTANFFQTFYSISKRVRCPSPAQPYVRKYCDSYGIKTQIGRQEPYTRNLAEHRVQRNCWLIYHLCMLLCPCPKRASMSIAPFHPLCSPQSLDSEAWQNWVWIPSYVTLIWFLTISEPLSLSQKKDRIEIYNK